MSARSIIDSAPLGSVILVSDGTLEPPERFRRKLADWQRRNFTGTLIELGDGCERNRSIFTLREGDISSGGVILVIVRRVFGADSPLTFNVKRRPTPGAPCVVRATRRELLHLAADRTEAEQWLAAHRYRDAVIEDIVETGTETAGEAA